MRFEKELFEAGAEVVIACDEVGRGALAGPVAVGLVVVGASATRLLPGLRDSKLLSEARRERIAPRVATWVKGWAVGEASASEIDSVGIMTALGLAGSRAWDRLEQRLIGDSETLEIAKAMAGAPLILDGNYDWLSPSIGFRAQVMTKVKADMQCGSVAAASVLAKVHRDRIMREYAVSDSRYHWAQNKGYSSARHLEALDLWGASELHRKSWIHPERRR